MDKFIYDNISYGGKKLTVNTQTGTYYEAAFKVIGALIAVSISLIIVLAILAAMVGLSLTGGEIGMAGGIIGILMGAVYMLGYVLIIAVAQAIYRATIRNHLFANAELDNLATFQSKAGSMDYCKLLATNYLMIIFSFGLAYPVTKIRTAAYLASVTEVSVNTEIDKLTDPLTQESSTFLEEAADLYDIDFSLT
jgi:uncharacterized membrane protein YjgN (DUF898 family)